MKKYLLTFAALLFISSASFAQTDSFDALRKSVQPLLGDDKIIKVSEVEKTGIFEIVTGRSILYTNKTGSVLLEGQLIDTKSRENLTEKSNSNLGAFNFNDIPLKGAIKTVRGDGSRRVITFEDPNCGWCRKLMTEFNKLTNVTVYTFIVPVLGEDSKGKAKAILCASNPTKTWVDLMSNANYSITKKECDVSFNENIELMQKLRLRGTPAILFENNTKVPGFMTSEKIEAKLKG